MNIKEFLEQINTGLLPKSSVFLFVGAPISAPLVSAFSRRLIALFKLQERCFLGGGAEEASQLLAQLRVSFLGYARFCWLGSLGDYDASVRDALKELLPMYIGPHVIGVLVTADEAKRISKGGTADLLEIEVPEAVDDETFVLLAQLLGFAGVELKKLFCAVRGGGINQLATVLSYAFLAGGKVEQLYATWLPRIVESEQSLFELSKIFFSRDKHAFLKLWKQVGVQYPHEFWVVFWAEQFWQAWLVVRSMKLQGVFPERKLINRLPFSFTQRDWKKYQERELVAAHNALYQVDYALKNGGSAGALEVVLLRFLMGGFARV